MDLSLLFLLKSSSSKLMALLESFLVLMCDNDADIDVNMMLMLIYRNMKLFLILIHLSKSIVLSILV